jgi:uncharacterized protein with NRDE domain
MCLVLVALGVRSDAPLVIAANRDEFHARPTAPAAFWPEPAGMLAGRDLLHGGTWLAVARSGRFAAVTNIREPSRHRRDSRSRGELPVQFVDAGTDPGSWLGALWAREGEYGGYNILVGDAGSAWYASNRDPSGPRKLSGGLHGLSNSILDDPWRKATGGVRDLEEVLRRDELSVESIFEVLTSEEQAPDVDLPETGVGLEKERLLSSRFVRMPDYGTRSSVVVLYGSDGHLSLAERTWPVRGGLPETRRFRFRLHMESIP